MQDFFHQHYGIWKCWTKSLKSSFHDGFFGFLEVNISKTPLKKNTWVCKWSQRIQPAGSMWRDSAFVNVLFDHGIYYTCTGHNSFKYPLYKSRIKSIEYIYTVCISINCPQCFCNYPSIFRGWSHQFSAEFFGVWIKIKAYLDPQKRIGKLSSWWFQPIWKIC